MNIAGQRILLSLGMLGMFGLMPPVGAAELGGRVVDAATGTGLAGATVRLFDAKKGREKGTLRCDAEGGFHFDALRPGAYVVTARENNRLSLIYPDIALTEGQIDKEALRRGQAIEIGKEGVPAPDLILKLERPIEVKGFILGTDGPLEACQIYAIDDQGRKGNGGDCDHTTGIVYTLVGPGQWRFLALGLDRQHRSRLVGGPACDADENSLKPCPKLTSKIFEVELGDELDLGTTLLEKTKP